MTSQIVATCRNPIARTDGQHMERARAVVLLAEVHGGNLVAWGADSASFAWDEGESEGVLGFLSSLREPPSQVAAWAVGVAEGELVRLGDAGRRSELSFGPALTLSTALALRATGGETLADGSLELVRHGVARTSGDPVELIDFPEVSAVAIHVVGDAPAAARDTDLGPAPESAEHEPRTLPVPAKAGAERESAVNVPVASRPPADLLVTAGGASGAKPLQGANSAQSVQGGQKGVLFDRVSKRAHDAGSESGAAGTIAALRRARDEAAKGPPAVHCQASLALAIALATMGRQEDALLDGLDALARAKEAADSRAVDASLAFLSKLFTSVGRYADAAKMRPVRG